MSNDKITFTPSVVRRIAEQAATVTDHAVALGDAHNPGDGLRYTDAHDATLVWRGKTAARQAAAYYAGAAAWWAATTGTELPAPLSQAATLLGAPKAQPQAVLEAWEAGQARAERVHETRVRAAVLPSPTPSPATLVVHGAPIPPHITSPLRLDLSSLDQLAAVHHVESRGRTVRLRLAYDRFPHTLGDTARRLAAALGSRGWAASALNRKTVVLTIA